MARKGRRIIQGFPGACRGAAVLDYTQCCINRNFVLLQDAQCVYVKRDLIICNSENIQTHNFLPSARRSWEHEAILSKIQFCPE